MELTRLTDKQHLLYPTFEYLYHISFPVFEQRTDEQQSAALASPAYHLEVHTEQDVFVGFVAYWEFDTYLYIEHLAIHPDLRGKGYGGKVLEHIGESSGKRLLLEIDPVTDDVSANRLHFYVLNGFYANPYEHIHPSYREDFQGHKLIVLTTGGRITPEAYDLFNKDLNETVMCF